MYFRPHKKSAVFYAHIQVRWVELLGVYLVASAGTKAERRHERTYADIEGAGRGWHISKFCEQLVGCRTSRYDCTEFCLRLRTKHRSESTDRARAIFAYAV